MKKITILALHLGFGGIEKSIVSLANILCTKYDVEIVTVYKLYDKPSFVIDERVKVKYLLANLKPNQKEFKQAVKNVKLVRAFKEGLKSLKILGLRRSKTIQYIKKCDSNVIIATRDIFDQWVSEYASDNVLKIGWEHNHYHGDMKYAERIVECSKNLDYLVLVSKSLKNFYKEKMRNDNCQCVFIPNIIEYVPKQVSKLDEKRLISIGRLSKEKGYMDLLVIFNNIHKDYPEWKLEIIGDGNERGRLEKYIEDNALGEFVTLHGFRERDYIYDMLLKSSIYLMTSHTESFGIVLLEAMSAGLPCIAFSSAEGANEIINSGSNGYLIKRRNMEVYIKKVEDLMDDIKVRKKIGVAARKSIERYTPLVVEQEWFKLVEKR